MTSRSSSLARFPISAIGLAAVGLALGGLAFANTDTLLERGFERALARSPDTSGTTLARREAAAGSEDFWLRKARPRQNIVPAAAKPLAVGDPITISSGGVDRVLTVTAVSELPAGFEQVVADGRTRRLVLVTCRERIRGGDGPLVHLVLDADGGWPAVFGVGSPRAL